MTYVCSVDVTKPIYSLWYLPEYGCGIEEHKAGDYFVCFGNDGWMIYSTKGYIIGRDLNWGTKVFNTREEAFDKLKERKLVEVRKEQTEHEDL